MCSSVAGGRAGRHGKQWEFGEVTCLKAMDMEYMHNVSLSVHPTLLAPKLMNTK